MPISVHINKEKDLTTFKVVGILDFDAVMSAVKAFYTGNPTKHVLWDDKDATDVKLTSDEVGTIARLRERFEGKREAGKTALVAHKDIVFGLSRMFEVQSSLERAPYDVMVFRNIDDACKWLDEP